MSSAVGYQHSPAGYPPEVERAERRARQAEARDREHIEAILGWTVVDLLAQLDQAPESLIPGAPETASRIRSAVRQMARALTDQEVGR
ncbi:hypothetical protein [Thiococcus pfennigii]|uniref:hypothetical protein n=1 Tax=Thiococcus pfennigii TaxID=1057 RepID=UPI0019053011|nr:hypothetical protein [Thiococcus pfennigii]MBK1699774.1 hypothetical protein [Thiococcus pfennigii]